MTIIVILSAIVALLLIVIVLVQNPKGGGLASNYSQGTQLFGVERTNDIVEKITWGLAISIVIISLLAASYNTGRGDRNRQDQQQKPPVEQTDYRDLPIN